MEKYKYYLHNAHKIIDFTEAMTCDEAMRHFGLENWKVEKELFGMAMICSPTKKQFAGITWETI